MSEATPEDRAEQEVTPTREVPPSPAPDVPLEAPAADVQEQAARVGPGEHVTPRDVPLEADAADTAEQSTVVEIDEDERR